MNVSRTKTYKKKRQQKRVFSILTLIFLLVQTILTPVAQYVNAEGSSVNVSFNQTEAKVGDTLTATLSDTGGDSGMLTFTVNGGLSIKGIAGGQGNVDIATQQDQTMSFTWKEGSSKTLTVNVAANEAGSGTAILTSENGGTSSAAVQITAQEEVVSDEATDTEDNVVASQEVEKVESAEEQKDQEQEDEQNDEDIVEYGKSVEIQDAKAVTILVDEEETTTEDEESEEATFATERAVSGTANHIDIGITVEAKLTVGNETLTENLKLVSGDFTSSNVTITATQGGETFKNFSPDFKDISTSTGASGIRQFRIGGSYPVGTASNPVKYTVVLKKTVTFISESGTKYTVPMSFTATFNYWQAENDCPGIRDRNSDGTPKQFEKSAGLDFVLGSSAENMGILTIQKNLVDENGKPLAVTSGTYTFDVYNSNNEKVDTVVVSTGTGSMGLASTDLPYGTYYIVENVSAGNAVIDGYKLDDVLINDVDSTTSSEFKIGSNAKTVTLLVENIYKEAFTSVNVTKVWDDAGNQDGIRPASVTVQLYADNVAVTGKTLTLSNENGWSGAFVSLPVEDSNGKDIAYTVAEADVNGYKASVTGSAEAGYTITNSYTPKTTSISAKKVWVDNNNQDGIRTDVTLRLMKKVEGDSSFIELAGKEKVISKFAEEKHLEVKWDNLPVYENGKLITYTVAEDTIEGYTTEITGDAAVGFTVTNTHIPVTTSVSGIKMWSDADNQDGKRPESITVNLLADGTKVDSVTVTAEESWEYSFENLPKYKSGQEIKYTVTENAVTDYTTNVDGFNITNTHTPDKTSVNVTKVWDDSRNQDGIRPDSISVQLYADELAYGDPVDLSEANNWTYRWSDLYVNSEGEPITYTVEEVDVPDGYTSKVTGDATTGFTITNTHERETIEVSGKKVWNDKNDQDGIRPSSIRIYLYSTIMEGEVERTDQIGYTDVEADKVGNWKFSWGTEGLRPLPKYYKGQKVKYTIKEVAIDGYDTDITSSVNEDGDIEYTVTNTHTPETVDISGTKTWEDADNQDGKRPISITVNLLANGKKVKEMDVMAGENGNWTYKFIDLAKFENGKEIVYTVTEEAVDDYSTEITGTNIKNSYTPEQTSVTVTKAWDDKENQDGIRPNFVIVSLLADGVDTGKTVTLSADNNWSDTFTGLDKYKDAGMYILYTVKEQINTSEYTFEVTGSVKDGFVVTNTHEVERTAISVEKKWEDQDNQDGIRPDSVTVQLMADGESYGDPVKLNAKNDWAYTWKDLDVNKNGEQIKYTVVEDEVKGYTPTISEAEGGYIITNTHKIAQTNVSVEKKWDDQDNQDGIRPDSVTVQLMADGESYGDPVKLNAKNDWAYTWKDLDVNKNGEQIKYTVVEDEVKGYTPTISEAEGGYIITNTHKIAQTNVSVEKKWDDQDNQDGIRPDSVTVQLMADGESYGDPVKLNAQNDWAYTWKDLDVNKNGEQIKYTVVEDEVKGYTPTISEAEGGYIITNTHKVAQTNVSVEKKWEDQDNQDGIRPDSVTVQLMADGESYGDPVKLNAKNDWAYTWKDLDVNKNGEQIKYTVVEDEVKGYTPTISEAEGGYIITNTHKVAQTTVSVEKKWDDQDNHDEKRPDSVTVQLQANGEAFGEPVKLNAENEWAYTWTNLDVNKNGKRIDYTVIEEEVEGYTAVITGDAANGYTITNNYERGSLTVKKEVDSEDDEMNVEGAEFTFIITGKDYKQTITLPAGESKTLTALTPGEYSIVEIDPSDAYDGYILNGVHVNGKAASKSENDYTSGVIEVKKNNTSEVTFVNVYGPVGSLEVKKVDSKDDTKVLEGAEFTLTDKDGNEQIVKTDKNGFAAFDELKYGEYTLVETKAPEGYLFGKQTEWKVTIDKDHKVVAKTIENIKENPSLKVVKKADKEVYKNGDKVHYTITVTNDGNVDLAGISLEGVFSKDGNSDIEQLTAVGYDGPFDLKAGKSVVFDVYYKIPEADKGGTTYKNVVEVKVKVGDTEIIDEDEEIVIVESEPSLKIDKTADKEEYKNGDKVHYTITVTNDGNVDLEGISLEGVFLRNGERYIDLTAEGYDGPFDLAAGETRTFDVYFEIPMTDVAGTTYKNIATVKVGDNDTGIFDEDDAIIVVESDPGLTINKTADKDEVEVGETITYTIDVTNTGNTALTDVKVIDEMVGLDETISQLDVGETKTFTVTHEATSDDIGELTNLAVATVTIDGEEIVQKATATVIVTDVLGVAVEVEEPTTTEKVVATVKDIVNPKTGDDGLNLFLALVMFMFAGIGLYYTRTKDKH